MLAFLNISIFSIFVVDVKSGRFMYQSGRAGERETRQKSVSLPPKAGELASLQLLHVKRLPCRGVQVINHGSSRSSRIARQNLLNIVILRTIQRLWRRSDGKKINYNAETGKLRHYFEVSRWNVALQSFKSFRMTSALTPQEQQTATVYFQREQVNR